MQASTYKVAISIDTTNIDKHHIIMSNTRPITLGTRHTLRSTNQNSILALNQHASHVHTMTDVESKNEHRLPSQPEAQNSSTNNNTERLQRNSMEQLPIAPRTVTTITTCIWALTEDASCAGCFPVFMLRPSMPSAWMHDLESVKPDSATAKKCTTAPTGPKVGAVLFQAKQGCRVLHSGLYN